MAAMTNPEIEAIEREIGTKLPGLYHTLLFQIGPGRFGDLQIYHPKKVRELYEPFFDDAGQLFNPYFPFGCNNCTQELWIIDAATEQAASIAHETVPDDWPDEQWLPYEFWIERYLEPESGAFGSDATGQ